MTENNPEGVVEENPGPKARSPPAARPAGGGALMWCGTLALDRGILDLLLYRAPPWDSLAPPRPRGSPEPPGGRGFAGAGQSLLVARRACSSLMIWRKQRRAWHTEARDLAHTSEASGATSEGQHARYGAIPTALNAILTIPNAIPTALNAMPTTLTVNPTALNAIPTTLNVTT
eukprot:gene15609-biopygen20202